MADARIEDHGLIADGHTAALVHRRGSVDSAPATRSATCPGRSPTSRTSSPRRRLTRRAASSACRTADGPRWSGRRPG